MKDETFNMVVGAAFAGFKEAFSSVLASKGLKCDVKDCTMYSIGARCSCGKLLCNSHLYFKINTKTVKPESICPSCICENHPELFE